MTSAPQAVVDSCHTQFNMLPVSGVITIFSAPWLQVRHENVCKQGGMYHVRDFF